MAGLNKVMIIGRLGKDPELIFTNQGTAIANFSIATSEQWVDKNTGEKQEKTEWHRVVIFGKQAENAQKYIFKGSQIYVEGKLQTRTYEKDGQTHYVTEILARNIQYLSQQGGQQQPQQQAAYQSQQVQQPQQGGQSTAPMDERDDIPF